MKKQPLSIAFVLPVTFASGAPDPSQPGAASRGFEDTVLTARYRVDAGAVASALGLDQSYVMGVGGIEMPTGTFDHPFGKGAFGEIAAGLFSLEKRPLAAIAYVYYHHRGVYNGTRDSGNTFAGGGLAYTPVDDEANGKLFSLQLGMSYERTFPSEENGVPQADSGASGVFIHPGVVFSMTPSVQFFGLVSLPLTQQFNSIVDHQRFRLGTGIIWILQSQRNVEVRFRVAVPLGSGCLVRPLVLVRAHTRSRLQRDERTKDCGRRTEPRYHGQSTKDYRCIEIASRAHPHHAPASQS